jgi:MoaA/NifB/PqqE/SkfB family radical SAM enzyme
MSKFSTHLYDIHLIWDILGVCNFKCDYCLAESQHSSDNLKFIDVKKVREVLDTTGFTYEINLVGGEPTLIPNFLEICSELTQNHHLFLSTNLSHSFVFERMIQDVDPSHITGIDASFHVEERERKSSFKQFAESFHKLRKAGFPISANYVAHPRLMNRIESDFHRMNNFGVELRATPYIGIWQEKTYPDSYTLRERELLFDKKTHRGKWKASIRKGIKNQYCNAGYNAFWIARDGSVAKCTSFLSITYGNIYKKMLPPDTKMEICNAASCSCPYYAVLSHLFERAKIRCGIDQ